MTEEELPILHANLAPPVVRGPAPFAEAVVEGVQIERLLAELSGPFAHERAMLSAAFDTVVLSFLSNRRELGLALQQDMLGRCQKFRIAPGPAAQLAEARPLRLLGLVAPGDLQMNMPIEFIVQNLNVQLDLLYVVPGVPLPPVIPDHDVAMCLISDSSPEALARLAPLLARWPRPVLNNPAKLLGGEASGKLLGGEASGTFIGGEASGTFIGGEASGRLLGAGAHGRFDGLTRDGIARLFQDAPEISVPETVTRTRQELADHLHRGSGLSPLPGGLWPIVIRPVGSHAGQSLARLEDTEALAAYLGNAPFGLFYVSCFVDYSSEDGFFRKRRVAMIGAEALLCHVGISRDWMIHYLNAGMAESPAKRVDEARAMADFDTGFGRRHRQAFAVLQARLGLDYFIVDCAEAPDGSLLVFEVEMAAIIHCLDPIDAFAYKQPQMRRVFAAFEALLQRTARQNRSFTQEAPLNYALLAS